MNSLKANDYLQALLSTVAWSGAMLALVAFQLPSIGVWAPTTLAVIAATGLAAGAFTLVHAARRRQRLTGVAPQLTAQQVNVRRFLTSPRVIIVVAGLAWAAFFVVQRLI